MSSARAENRDKGFGMSGVEFFSKSCDCNPAMDLGFVGIQLAATAHYSKKADPRYPLNPSPNTICWPDFCSKQLF
jgi:hypothetical protein